MTLDLGKQCQCYFWLLMMMAFLALSMAEEAELNLTASSWQRIIKAVIPAKYIDENTKYHINPLCGPMMDSAINMKS